MFQTHFSSFGEEAWSETTPNSADTTFKWSFTHSLTHSLITERFSPWIHFSCQEMGSSIDKAFPVLNRSPWFSYEHLETKCWFNILIELESEGERERVLGTVFLFVFFSRIKVFFHPWFCFASYLWEDFCFVHLWEDHRGNSSRYWLLSVALDTHTSIVPHSSIGYLYLNCCGLDFFQFDHSGIFVAVFCIIFSLSCSCCILKIDRQHDNDCHNNIPALLQKTETEIIISCSMSSSCKILAHEKKDQYTTIQALLQKTHIQIIISCKILAWEEGLVQHPSMIRKDCWYNTIQALLQKIHTDHEQLSCSSCKTLARFLVREERQRKRER